MLVALSLTLSLTQVSLKKLIGLLLGFLARIRLPKIPEDLARAARKGTPRCARRLRFRRATRKPRLRRRDATSESGERKTPPLVASRAPIVHRRTSRGADADAGAGAGRR